MVEKLQIKPDKKFQLIGIATVLKDYKLIYHLTQYFGWEIIRVNHHVAETKDKMSSISFGVFRITLPDTVTVFYLFANKNGNEQLLPEGGHFDFLLKLGESYLGTSDLAKDIATVPDVLAASVIPVASIKNHARLSYDEPVDVVPRPIKRK